MITLQRYRSRMEAEIARGILESSGIYSLVIADERHLALQVMPDDASLAQEILSVPMVV